MTEGRKSLNLKIDEWKLTNPKTERKSLKKNEQNLRDLWDNIVFQFMCNWSLRK